MIANQIAGLLTGGVVASATDYESIATVNVGSTVSSISFSSIPSTYTHLQIRAIFKGDFAGNGSAKMIFNGDNGSNYTEYHNLYGDGSSAASFGSTTANAGIQMASGNGSVANNFSAFVLDILDYKSTNINKTVRSLSGNDMNGSGTIRFFSGLWRATPAAVTDITISLPGQSIVSRSHFALYGIK